MGPRHQSNIVRSQVSILMSIISFSYPKSCTRPDSIQGLQENDHLEVDLLRMIEGKGRRLCKLRYEDTSSQDSLQSSAVP
jgi:hypothetical protein